MTMARTASPAISAAPRRRRARRRRALLCACPSARWTCQIGPDHGHWSVGGFVAHALVLNATYEPLCVVSSRRALVLILAGKAVAVESSDTVLHSERAAFRVPLVVRLTRFVRVPYHGHVPLTRRAVFARDGGRCVYCASPATSLDHAIPRSRGGEHTCENVVSRCRRCHHA